jgi:hypothetical protein
MSLMSTNIKSGLFMLALLVTCSSVVVAQEYDLVILNGRKVGRSSMPQGWWWPPVLSTASSIARSRMPTA